MSKVIPPSSSLAVILKALRLSTMASVFEEYAERGVRQNWSFEDYLRELTELELHERQRRRIERYIKESCLPAEKTFATFDKSRLPNKIRKQLPDLCKGYFLDRSENILAFGLPGRGKTHLLCAIGHELVRQERRVFYCSTYKLVQRLLIAKRDLTLEKELAKLDKFEAVLLDDIGYVKQTREEMEILFTFLAERYERRSVLITSNLVFSKWEQIFKDPMTTAAAIDRLVHHSTIMELTGKSFRAENAGKKWKKEKDGRSSNQTGKEAEGDEEDQDRDQEEKK
jgi:DNA replication protein DnaC